MFKVINLVLLVMIVALQVRLWFGENSVAQAGEIKVLIEEQSEKNLNLDRRNKMLNAQIQSLSNENEYEEIEERARKNLGLIKEGETFFLTVDKK